MRNCSVWFCVRFHFQYSQWKTSSFNITEPWWQSLKGCWLNRRDPVYQRVAQKAQSRRIMYLHIARGCARGMERVTFRRHIGGGKSNYHITTSALIPIHLSPHARTAGWHCIHEWPQNIINWITWGSICHCVCQIARALCLLLCAIYQRAFVWLSECWHRLSCFCLVNSSFYKYESQACGER
jgi:hypothetical protein